jgi:hypothetical protein
MKALIQSCSALSGVKPLKSLTKKTTKKVIHSPLRISQKPAILAGDIQVSVAQTNI